MSWLNDIRADKPVGFNFFYSKQKKLIGPKPTTDKLRFENKFLVHPKAAISRLHRWETWSGDVDRVALARKTMQDRPLDAEWIAALIAIRDRQDTGEFARLFQHFAPRIKAFLIKSGANDTMAEDCAQDVMTTVWQKAHLFDPTRASVATWIFTIARNRRIDMIRKEKRPEPEDLPWGPEAEPDQAEVLEIQQESEKLQAALIQLPEKQRILVERCYFGDMSHSEIATETGLPLGTIKSRLRLALEKLRHELK